jgi:hypothetical protein
MLGQRIGHQFKKLTVLQQNIVLKTSVTKRWKHVPQAVPKSMCYRISSVMGFGTAIFDHPDIIVL